MPCRRLRMISSRCFSSGRPFTSTTLSSMRVKTRTTAWYSSQSKCAWSRERIAHEARQVDRAEQARAIRRQRLFATRVGCANRLAPPVVVHLVDAIDEHEAGFGEIVGGSHDDVPHALRGHGLVDLAEHQAFDVAHVVRRVRPFTPDVFRGVGNVFAGNLGLPHGEGQFPIAVFAHGAHEIVGDEQRQVELPQPARLALRANELHGVGVTYIERAHLCAATATRRRDRETHLVVDIHERQRTGRIGARARHISAARTQRRKFIADAAAGFQRQARLVHLAEDVVHRVANGAGHRAVDRRGGGLVLQRSGVRRNAAGGDGAATQRPEELLIPVLAHFGQFDIGERPRDTFIGVIHVAVDRRAVLGRQAVFLVPDVEGRFLERDAACISGLKFHGGAHCGDTAPQLTVRRIG